MYIIDNVILITITKAIINLIMVVNEYFTSSECNKLTEKRNQHVPAKHNIDKGEGHAEYRHHNITHRQINQQPRQILTRSFAER